MTNTKSKAGIKFFSVDLSEIEPWEFLPETAKAIREGREAYKKGKVVDWDDIKHYE